MYDGHINRNFINSELPEVKSFCQLSVWIIIPTIIYNLFGKQLALITGKICF